MRTLNKIQNNSTFLQVLDLSLPVSSECPPTLYGPGCGLQCSVACRDELCNHMTGDCLACPDGKMGDLCEQGECCHGDLVLILDLFIQTTTFNLSFGMAGT